jgi:hypothetical protein
MNVGEVFHVNVIADARAVSRWIVVAEDPDGMALPKRHLEHTRDQMRLRMMVFAHSAVRCGAGGVEVAQGRCKSCDGVTLTECGT